MPQEDFYSTQTDITAAKIKFYKDYIGTYLIKVLMTYGNCYVADLFCGPGKNGGEKGSPLTLIDEAKKMLESPVLLKKFKTPAINIFFNDIEASHVTNLKVELEGLPKIPGICIERPTSKHFRDVLGGMSRLLKYGSPKFFFLDPFTYSDVELADIALLMQSPHTEVLLFLPAFFAYRFSGCETEPKTEKFLESFTTRGGTGYRNFHDFMDSMIAKVKGTLCLDYVRPIILDAGSKKNVLLFLTKSKQGMALMNEIVWKHTDDGKTFTVTTEDAGPSLFGEAEIEAGGHEIARFEKLLCAEIKNRKSMTNVDIIDFTIKAGFLPKHADWIIKKHKPNFQVVVTDGEQNRSYISAPNINKARSIIKYKD